ncbi:MAG: pyridoxamine 5'-phosphate oxidase family protein [Clostridiales bacterium]|nr:pyridoxamine 5'-phosphate oxidase family protein [Clostridiales bacterium]MDD7035618.1 pyridoxamine 5'-phosphate oxidase family protein [Bacillota bacterium]MDY2920231.1 pyridoxamine 5'-phosphate oxidase family protein [Lentihominibacter sp.]
MRQQNREIKDFNEIVEVMKKCDVCRLALNDEGYPYIIPLNFGMDASDGKITLYFHSALEGYKVDLIKKDPRASFEMDCNHLLQYFEDKGYCTMAYESVIGRGMIRILGENDKKAALQKLMAQYHSDEGAYFNPAAIDRTLVYALEVQSITGKRKLPK